MLLDAGCFLCILIRLSQIITIQSLKLTGVCNFALNNNMCRALEPRVKGTSLRPFPQFIIYYYCRSCVADVLTRLGVQGRSLSGVVLDAGPSLAQLTQPHRGFCDTKLYKLDMRMDGPGRLVLASRRVYLSLFIYTVSSSSRLRTA